MSLLALVERRILIVEDEYLAAKCMADALQAAGARVVGPAASVAKARALLDRPDPIQFALLDLNLGGESALPLADELTMRGVPFVFLTGYDASAIPQPYRAAPRLVKPLSTDDVLRLVGDALEARLAADDVS
ncbi:response regulator [Luteimonas sp BLCC-B24]|uniref:response regulator n=1 Tax=Luteimonas sp. BLCC-B24 TaxID=3025317 RepID=UPI00234DE037|nr:response regulator [Luteimonas sp. BLCC-B24]MDC7807553.1 response regulator [Luteimonas sp. BLCC-B24]